MKRGDADNNEEGWEFGDVWKEGTPDEKIPEEKIEYVEVLRGDMGRGYDDSVMVGLVVYLGSLGIKATYDAVPLATEMSLGMKTYVLKVEAGKEDEAIGLLKEKFKEQRLK
ncbi:MAG TPA: hypothetical protein VF903_04875 [Nitrospirota bacterium]